VHRIETVRLYPNTRQRNKLDHMLHLTRKLYNALVEERKEAYRRRRMTVTAKHQYAELTSLRGEDPNVASVYREVEDAVLHRLELSMRAFFRRLSTGGKPGYPRYRSETRWRQIEFPHGNRALKLDASQRRLRVPSLGWIRLRKGRPIPENYGRAWLIRKGTRWFCQFECQVQLTALPSSGRVVGIDRGVRVLLATSDGERIPNPHYLQLARLKIERIQRIVAKRKSGGCNRRKAAARLARLHESVALARRDYAHKVARKLVDTYDAIALEDLRLQNMVRSAKGTREVPGRCVGKKAALNRAVLDAGFGLIARLIEEKAERAARPVVRVDPHNTSQKCSKCGRSGAAARRGSRYSCSGCDYQGDADVNAAVNILRRAELRPVPRCAGLPDVDDARSVLAPAGGRFAQRVARGHA
jgi:putative transposase